MAYTKDVLAVVGAKGGVGKTTTSLNLAAAMAAAGHSVVAVELDIGMANFVDFLDVEVEDAATVHDVLAGESTIESARYRVADGFFIAPSGTQLTGYANTDLARLPGIVDDLAWYHDAIVLDTPAGVGEEIVRSLELADEAILVSTPRVASIRNAKNTIELTDRIGTDVRGLVLTKSGTGASPGADRIADFLDVPLLGHVPEDDAVPHSQDRGKPVVDYAPRSGAAIAYRTIAEKLLENAPVPERSTADSGDEDRQADATVAEDDPLEHRERPAESTEQLRAATDGTGAVVGQANDRESESTASSGDEPGRTTHAARSEQTPTDDEGADDPVAPDSGEHGEPEKSHRPGDPVESTPTSTDETATPADGRPTDPADGEDGSDVDSASDDTIDDGSIGDESVSGDTIDDDSIRDESVSDDTIDDDSIRDESVSDDTIDDDTIDDDSIRDESAGQVSSGDPVEGGVDRDGASETDGGGDPGDAERTDRLETDKSGADGTTAGDPAGDPDDADSGDVDESDSVGGRLRSFFGL